MSTALTIQNDLPAPAMEVIPAEMAERMEATLALAQTFVVISADNIDSANAAAVRLHMLHRDVIAQGERIKKPLNSLIRAVRDCVDRAEHPLASAKGALGGRIAAYNKEVTRVAEMEALRVREEQRKADEAAAAETRRLQAEAQAKADQQAKDMEDLIGEAVEVAPEPVPEVKAAVIAPTVIIPAKPSAIVTRKETKLVIDDPKAIAQAYAIGGEVLVTINNAAVRRLLDAGVAVPGARLEMVETLAMRSVR